MKHLVFVYGSLKKGFPNYHVISEGDDSQLIMETTTSDNYDMISLGVFPAVIKQRSWAKIKGEVYAVDDLTMDVLDMLESNGEFYRRELISVDFMEEPVWCYFLMKPNSYQPYDYKNVATEKNALVWKRNLVW
jgi:gamma-glutamylcyclotransferase (GGCT)/AIG2-like uncharacterized protein YtfP